MILKEIVMNISTVGASIVAGMIWGPAGLGMPKVGALHDRAVKAAEDLGKASSTLRRRVAAAKSAWNLAALSEDEFALVRKLVDQELIRRNYYGTISNQGPIEAQFREKYGMAPSEARLDDDGQVVRN